MKKITSIFLALALVLLSTSAFAVTLAWNKYNPSTDGNVVPQGYNIYTYTETYIENNHATAVKNDAGLPTTTPDNEFTIPNFTPNIGTKYIFVATAYAIDSTSTPTESLDSNTAEYIYRGPGLNNPPGTISPPTGFRVVDQNNVAWSAGTGGPIPVGYRLYYYVKNTQTMATKDFIGTATTGSLDGINFTPNVWYTMHVVALVYDVNGINYKESLASSPDDYMKVSGPTGVPSKPSGLKIKP